MNGILLLQSLIFGFTLWFGLYLLARDLQKPGLRFAGLGLVSYALGLALAALVRHVPEIAPAMESWWYLPVLLPSVFWMAATWHLLPDTTATTSLNRNLMTALLLIVIVLFTAAAFEPGVARVITALVPIGFLLVALTKIRLAFRSALPRQPIITLLAATIFFMLGTALLIVPIEWLSNELVLLAIHFDLLLLGGVIGYLDAYEEGTKLLPDAMRSLIASGGAALLLGGQVALIMALSNGGDTAPFTLLLFTVVGTTITLEIFSNPFQSLLDRFVFVDRPHIEQERRVLRSVSAALPRMNDTLDLLNTDEAEFVRFTRRALSHLNDLDKLASSPLTQLPAVGLRLQQEGKADTTLERTTALKAILTDNILRLKPYSDQDFDPSDEWRYYNVLYFPYVRGLKPYSVRYQQDSLDDAAQAALEWLQHQVPERTLYNWQTTAAKVVAKQLREINQGILAD